MKAFAEWLIYLLTGAYVIAMAGAGIGLFFHMLTDLQDFYLWQQWL